MMHKLPVDAKVFEEALKYKCRAHLGGDWEVGRNIMFGGQVVWSQLKGLHPVSDYMSYAQAVLEYLLKARHVSLLPEWRPCEEEQRFNLVQTQRQKVGPNGKIWPDEARTGAEYVEACAWYDRVEAELTSPAQMGVKISASSIRAVSKIQKAAAGLRQVTEQLREANEQPWERTKRIAARAGYAHVPAEETLADSDKRWRHEGGLVAIEKGCVLYDTYAHHQPADCLSGTRTMNGWAVAGFAVTDGATMHWGNAKKEVEGETTCDKRGALIREKALVKTSPIQDFDKPTFSERECGVWG